MANTTTLHIRIDEADKRRIDSIEGEFGGRSEVMRLVDEWASEVGRIDEEEVTQMTAKCFS